MIEEKKKRDLAFCQKNFEVNLKHIKTERNQLKEELSLQEYTLRVAQQEVTNLKE